MFNVNLHANRYLDDVQPSISANPGVESDPDNPYYTLRYGDLAIFLSDAQCRQLLAVLGSRPDLPKTDAQIDAESVDPSEVIRLDITELNTMSDPKPGWMDETVRIRCPRCGHMFLLGRGMVEDPRIRSVTRQHILLCEGDAAVTLMKVEQAYKAGWRPCA